ncbi:zinc finger protein 510-like isoform X4 [Trichogramma pretiosum]|uniref:zinc finger protein 510-like isoform X4 n=1 Tax=Trichogramma pretiosum TaxID=7493 RepID=UPI000C71AD0F|nr:zinc finger protein 510-like isoform X4 [Trichogramma pretiosum]
MESSDMLNCAVRVKEETIDVSFLENECEMIDEKPDVKNIQLLPFSLEKPAHKLREYDENQETDINDEMEIEFECVDVKLTMDLLVNNKSDEYSRNHLQLTKYSKDYQNQNKIKEETVAEVKKEVNLNFDYELNGRNEKMNDIEKLKDGLEIRTEKVHRHECNICGKTFPKKSNLKTHIDAAHNGIAPICKTCGKTFVRLDVLKRHMNSVHDKVTHECDICGKKFLYKINLKKHIDSVHDKVA